MTGLIIVTHAELAQGFLDAAFMIIGPQKGVVAYCSRCGEQPEEMEQELKKKVEILSQGGDGVLIMTDMFGGTPTNICLSLLNVGRVEVLTGVSLPMVLKFFSYRDKVPLHELATMIKTYAQQGVVLVSETVAE